MLFFSETICDFKSHVENCAVGPVIVINERGQEIPPEKWERTVTRMRNETGLNFGNDTEENLVKFIDMQGKVGYVEMLTIPVKVRIDQTSHAANQQYRWEHRYDQVSDEEILGDVRMAAPKILEIVLNDDIDVGTRQIHRDAKNRFSGHVWLYNIRTGLNIIVQVKHKEQNDGQMIKFVVVTMKRQRDMTWTRAYNMPKITVSDSEARIVYVPNMYKN